MKNRSTIGAAGSPGQGAAAGRTAVVLLSGGLDSATAAAWALAQGFRLAALSVEYGQRHRVELDAARDVARALGIERHVVVPLDLATFGGSALVDTTADVPKGRSEAAMAAGIPVTYVPARNTVFLALALGMAEASGADAIVLGVNAVDYSGYPDCRPEFIEAFARLAGLATKVGVEGRPIEILAPLISMTKADIIRAGIGYGIDYGLTTSCYDPLPGGRPCGECDSCLIRAAGFAVAESPDPRCDPSRWQ